DASCKDMSPNCVRNAFQCDTNSYVRGRCRKTCGLCGGPQAPLPAVHGGWSPLTSWTSCSTDCQRYRWRSCIDPTPSNGGRNCTGEHTFSEKCTTGQCANSSPIIDISPPTKKFECGIPTKVVHAINYDYNYYNYDPAGPDHRESGLITKRSAGSDYYEYDTTFKVYGIHGPDVTESTRNAWPWMALLGEDIAGSPSWFCSGVILNQQWVLTAAHCTNYRNVTRVRLGEHDFSNDDDGVGVRVEDFAVAEVIYHPGYEPPQAYHDISLIRLSKPVELRREIMPICLPWGHEADLPLEDEPVIVTGWGAREFGGPFSPVLNEVNLTVFKTEICANSYSTLVPLDYKYFYPQSLRKESLCVGDSSERENDSCEGDSGGPAVLLRDSRYTLIGIISKGVGCGKNAYSGIYVNAQYP
ncbi:unnamed protein product, partial [Meganyctiphanes norvegica]